MAHGKTLEMRAIQRPEPEIHVAVRHEKSKRPGWFRKVQVDGAYVNAEKDRSLPGKARRRARREAKRAERRPFFKGHGVASENAYNARYDCPCRFGIVAPLDDFEFMAEVMEHEAEHTEAAS